MCAPASLMQILFTNIRKKNTTPKLETPDEPLGDGINFKLSKKDPPLGDASTKINRDWDQT